MLFEPPLASCAIASTTQQQHSWRPTTVGPSCPRPTPCFPWSRFIVFASVSRRIARWAPTQGTVLASQQPRLQAWGVECMATTQSLQLTVRGQHLCQAHTALHQLHLSLGFHNSCRTHSGFRAHCEYRRLMVHSWDQRCPVLRSFGDCVRSPSRPPTNWPHERDRLLLQLLLLLPLALDGGADDCTVQALRCDRLGGRHVSRLPGWCSKLMQHRFEIRSIRLHRKKIVLLECL